MLPFERLSMSQHLWIKRLPRAKNMVDHDLYLKHVTMVKLIGLKYVKYFANILEGEN